MYVIYWCDLRTEKEYFDKAELEKEIAESEPDMESLGAALDEVYSDEVINELRRLGSPLYDRLVVRAKELIMQDSIVEAKEFIYDDDYEDEDDE
jgi:hypothetical protein